MLKVRSKLSSFKSLRFISISCPLQSDEDDKKSEAIEKLNSLLSDLTKPQQQIKPSSKINLAKPQQLRKKISKEKKEDNEEKQPKDLAEKLEVAAKKVADSYGGDTRKTESELLNLLLAYQKDPTGESPSSPKPSLGDLITGMKVERKPREDTFAGQKGGPEGRAREVSQSLQGKRPLRQPQFDTTPQKVDLWSEPNGLGIFDMKNDFVESPPLTTWSKLHAKELKLSITHPPNNIYEQMILWTEQGKLWHFPINNEQGMVKESQIHFTEHIMLDRHIESWCPKKGPIRNFMELVLVGLSKNPYYTVEEKIEHIEWFRDYFAYKNDILKSLELEEIKEVNPKFKESLDIKIDYKAFV